MTVQLPLKLYGVTVEEVVEDELLAFEP